MAITRQVREFGSSPNLPCHIGMEKTPFEGKFPLGLVTSCEYHHRMDDCFLALVDAGADLRSQTESEEQLGCLKKQLMMFAFRLNASLEVLKVVLELGVADTEWARERLVMAATKRYWYHGVGPDGKDIWTLQDESQYFARQFVVLSKVPLSMDQRAKFWCGYGERPLRTIISPAYAFEHLPLLPESLSTRVRGTEC
ncbi:hypothetical protein SLS64_006890 [Diaporthe eres]|uniref:Uncharacterized protein n=1 Tax=Diaporthe eres TaxID=83184 RepID=A0ABR1PB36_DIAER